MGSVVVPLDFRILYILFKRTYLWCLNSNIHIILHLSYIISLLRNKRFLLKFFEQRFKICYLCFIHKYKNPKWLFPFLISCCFILFFRYELGNQIKSGIVTTMGFRILVSIACFETFCQGKNFLFLRSDVGTLV